MCGFMITAIHTWDEAKDNGRSNCVIQKTLHDNHFRTFIKKVHYQILLGSLFFKCFFRVLATVLKT